MGEFNLGVARFLQAKALVNSNRALQDLTEAWVNARHGLIRLKSGYVSARRGLI